MRILHVTQRFWPAVGGSEIHFKELSTRLVADGHHVTVLTTDALDFELFWNPVRRRVVEPEGDVDGVRILRFPVRHLPLSQLSYPAWRRLLWLSTRTPWPPTQQVARLARFTPWVPDLWRWLATTDEPFDLVAGMTICFEPLLAAGLDFARRRNLPFVIYPLTHLGAGTRPGHDPVSTFYTMRHQVDLVRQSTAVIAQTRSEKQFYVDRGVDRDRIAIAGPGIEPTSLAGGDGERFRERYNLWGPIVASIGSMSYDKGTVHVVEAMRQLWSQGSSAHLVLAGALLTPFQHRLDALPASDRQRIRVLPSVDEATKLDLLAALDILAMPSRTDSFGITYLEAWLYGKPVVGAQVWGVNDVIENGADGLLEPFGDVVALSAAIESLLTAPDIRRAMGERGRAKVLAHHTWTQKYAVTRQLYDQLVALDEPNLCAS